jgi:hypothetical protein
MAWIPACSLAHGVTQQSSLAPSKALMVDVLLLMAR